jgi:hypothetical protein
MADAPGTAPAFDAGPRVDPVNGHFLTPVGAGAYTDPFTGTLYAPTGGGTVVNTQTGQLIPG